MSARVLFYVQHLLGIGHLTRAATLARAMAARDLSVTVVSGGMPVEVLDTRGFDLVQLPPLRAADRTFRGLVDADGAPIDEAYRTRRRALLLAAEARLRPDAVMVELFPFGRRSLADEILALIDQARARTPRPRIVCSVRDILVEKNRPAVDAEIAPAARQYFDAILVHGDPDLVPFEATFAPARSLADLISYTGYVVEPALVLREAQHEGLTLSLSKGEARDGEVIVSAGSGATGEALLRTAMAARAATSLADAPWRLLAGPSLPEAVFTSLRRAAPAGVIVERARPDFTTLLANCALSISQGGYNTVLEVLAAGARAIVVPYGGGHETEQTLRARLLADRGLLHTIAETELTATGLAEAVAKALAGPRPRAQFDRGGAGKTADFIARMMAPVA